jgi:ribosome assembly protein RRB1
MGKKSKRNRASSNPHHKSSPSLPQQQQRQNQPVVRQRRLDDDVDDDEDGEEDVRRRTHPSLRIAEEETKDNLRFQDPFVEEYNEGDEWEDVDDDDDDVEEDDDDEEDNDGGGDGDNEVIAMKPASSTRRKNKSSKSHAEDENEMEDVVQTWNPFSSEHHQQLRHNSNNNNNNNNNNNGEPLLEMDATAYKMYHAIQNEWPSLSFDFINDTYGMARTKFPHTLLCVCGTQADAPHNNHITILKISDLHRIHIDTDDDILGEEINKDDDNDDDNEDDDNDDDDDIDDEEVEPVMEHYTIQHYGGVNRIRVLKQHYNSDIVASWSDTGTVNLYNIHNIRQRFLEPTSKNSKSNLNNTIAAMNPIPTQAFYSYHNDDEGVEGYALDWSPIVAGRMATGDCHGSIHLWTPTSNEGGSSYEISYLYNNVEKSKLKNTTVHSVEDVQWSPTEATVLAAASSDGTVRIYDIRKPGHVMIGHHIHDADVNVLSWNPLVTNLLATGGDDGTLAVYDLRHFTNTSSNVSSSGTKPKLQPLARFTPHTTPITSVEWHPTDESMLVASDDVGTYIYDLSVEEDDATAANAHYDTNTFNAVVVPPQLLFVHNGSEQFKEVHWHPQITSCVMTTALTGLSVFIPSNL